MISVLVGVLFILFAVIFVTLLERKILGYSQLRLGPNKVALIGVFQPALDGVKLIIKEMILPFFTNKIRFLLTPIIIFVSILMIWFWVFTQSRPLNLSLFVVFLLCVIGVTVYANLLSGWRRNSKYTILGAIRSSAQRISYEVILAICVFSVLILFNSLNILRIRKFNLLRGLFLIWPLFFSWSICCLAECNRAPFDFSEGERELVRGFNTEYGRRDFAILFIGEYGIVIFFSLITALLFFLNFSYSLAICWSLIWFFLLLRSCYPRYRYDKFIIFTWEKILPCVILWFFPPVTALLL